MFKERQNKEFFPREKFSHYCLNLAVRELYVKQDKIDVFLVEALSEAKNLREAADYYGDYSGINAKRLLGRAEKFIEKAGEIILKNH